MGKRVINYGRWYDTVSQIFLQVLEEIGEGNIVQLVSQERELTTQEAAELLSVSRPYLVRLLDENRTPSYRVGSHRRVRYKDILDYKVGRWSKRKATLDELSALDQKLGLNE
jgi:excisionase family DNA binding protein